MITLEQLRSAGYFVSFVFLLCGALRLARFNIQKNPVLRNPGRPDRKYFAGLPIPVRLFADTASRANFVAAVRERAVGG